MFTLIKNVRIYNPKDLGYKDILICNDKIIDINEKINIYVKDIEIIDGTNMLAFPGYIDQHVHVTGGGGEGGFKTKVPELNISNCIEGGVTTLVGVLGTDSITRNVENLVSKTKALNDEGITAYCLTGSYEYPSPTITGSVQKDIAFITEVIGVKIAISDHRCSNITKQELIRLISEVRLASLISNKPGIVHFHVGKGKDRLKMIFDILQDTDLPIKHFRPTHIKEYLEKDAVKFANLGGYIDFTASNLSDDFVDFIDKMIQQVPLDRITISTDSNGSMPKWNENKELVGIEAGKITYMHELLKCLIKERNLEIETVLSFITINVAKALEIYPRKGILSEGSDADILLLNNDLDIETVISKGNIMMMNKENLVKGVYEG